ncbi:hypothetical protein PHMEG_00015949 [Phytophthora megakarya]|uniref:RxLR effector protein n=1 Tax=Phytophthora megakarya TaxID=4795 RepID=A0A225W076_9STRA|nr:hypothetical protein PHMEG_00015949 [Phytophthora megakarya]
MFDGFGTLVKPFTKIKSTFQGAAVTKLAKNYDLTGAFKYLKLDKFKSVESLHLKDVDKLFASKKFNLWSAYLPRWNKQHSNEPYSVAKMFSQELGATKALDVFAVASTSKNPKVVQMGNNFQGQLLREFSRAGDDFDRIALQLGEGKAGNMFYNAIKSTSDSDSRLGERYAAKLLTKWATEGKNHDDVVKMVPSLGDSYTNMLLSLAIRANGRANDEAKIAAAAKKAVAAATPV